MKPDKSSEPRIYIATTVLLMLLSVASMLAIGLASNFESPAPPRQGSPAAASRPPVRTTQGVRVQALRAHVTQWVGYLSLWK